MYDAGGTDDEVILGAARRGDVGRLRATGAQAIKRTRTFPLREALKHRHAHVVAWLVEESERTGVDIAEGWRAMHLAAYLGDMTKLKAASDEELHLRAVTYASTLQAAAAGDQAEAIEHLMCERGLDERQKRMAVQTPFVVAAKYGSVAAIEALVACSAGSGDTLRNLRRALVYAVKHGQVAAVEKLVELGVDVRVTLVGSREPIVHEAYRSGREMIDCVVRHGADPCAVDGLGRTALHMAGFQPDAVSMARLAQLGAPLDAVTNAGQTALHVAYVNPEACRVLLDLGADRWVKDGSGQTPRDMASSWVRNGFFSTAEAKEVAELLATYFPIMPSMVQLLLGLKGPTESPLTRLAAHSLFEPNVLSLVNCLLTGKDDKAYEQLTRECVASSTSVSPSSSTAAEPRARQG